MADAMLSPQQFLALLNGGGDVPTTQPQRSGLAGYFSNQGADGMSLADRIGLMGAQLRDDPDVGMKAQALLADRMDRQTAMRANATQAGIVQRLLGPLIAGRSGAPGAPGPQAGGAMPTTNDGVPVDNTYGDFAPTAAPPQPSSPPAQAGISEAERQRRLTALAQFNPQLASTVDKILQGNQSWKQATDGTFYDEHGEAQPGRTANRTNVNDTIVDLNDPTNTNRVVQKAPVAGANPVYDNQGRVVDWTLPAGARNAIGSAQRAQADATNASQASYAEAISGGQERGKAPFTPDNREDESGAPVYGVVADRLNGGGGRGPRSGAAPGLRGQTPGDKEYSTNVGKDAAARYQGYVAAGQTAQGQLDNYRRIDQLLGDFEGGKFAGATTALASAANSLGFKVDPKLGNKQAADALTQQIALSLHSQLPGPMSNADRDYLNNMSPGMAQSATGRRTIISTQTQLAKRAQDYSRFAQRWAQKYGGINHPDASGRTFEDSLRVYAEMNPLFGGSR